MKIIEKIERKIHGDINVEISQKMKNYQKKFIKYSFSENKCIDERQYEAVITRWCHTIEKGLSYDEFKVGFGRNNIESLIQTLESYAENGYDINREFYRTALCILNEYVDKNRNCGYECESVRNQINNLPGKQNDKGGIVTVYRDDIQNVSELKYDEFILSRHSVRFFDNTDIDMYSVNEAIKLAQHTPSACNRQAWKTRVVLDKKVIKDVLEYQNGNTGFGHNLSGLILISGELQCFNREREIFQVFIDCGMYAQSILNALHFEKIATVPLSASLTKSQETSIRKILSIDDTEVLVMFIGIGNYLKETKTPRSERRDVAPIYI